MKLFISYNRVTGANHAEFLLAKIRQEEGWQAYIDTAPEQASNNYRNDIAIALQGCDTVLFVATKAACESDECKAEIRQAEGLGKRIVVCEFEEIESYPRGFESFHQVRFDPSYAVAWDRLKDIIRVGPLSGEPQLAAGVAPKEDKTDTPRTEVVGRSAIAHWAIVGVLTFASFIAGSYFAAALGLGRVTAGTSMYATEVDDADAKDRPTPNESTSSAIDETEFVAAFEEGAGIVDSRMMQRLSGRSKRQLLRALIAPKISDNETAIQDMDRAVRRIKAIEDNVDEIQRIACNRSESDAMTHRLCRLLTEPMHGETTPQDGHSSASVFDDVVGVLRQSKKQLATMNTLLVNVMETPENAEGIVAEIQAERTKDSNSTTFFFHASIFYKGNSSGRREYCFLEVDSHGHIWNWHYEKEQRRAMHVRSRMNTEVAANPRTTTEFERLVEQDAIDSRRIRRVGQNRDHRLD